ncbi:transglutaminase domain-containing protein [Sedimentibacter sp. zth1]|uniref:transglutaminase-like domain-containing protein n=1 Tax=Sedimentibacter sp. zth1 TaxID=2816908 RepID=UPI001A90F2F3|nr:transglutaminase-like domain-containing protein [Sedimentibacter sp. zth1]QSX06462.1 transglutaminase domain-containing protein [Sedimentibacter sp. zth1]
MNEIIITRKYIHPKSKEIEEFVNIMKKNTIDFQGFVRNIFDWFNKNIQYSRLNSPYFPLQRNDLEVLNMKSGTCGDYSNLLVSVFISMEIEANYAYIKKDCYGNEQDHICVAIKLSDEWILIDATKPYRKWHGYNCQHKEYKLYSPEQFEKIMKKEENYWYNKAVKWGNAKYAGLLYAPWIYEETVWSETDEEEDVFFLINLNDNQHWMLYINYFMYAKETAKNRIMVTINQYGEKFIQFSTKAAKSLWDSSQWGEKYNMLNIPKEYYSEQLKRMMRCITKNKDRVISIYSNIEK